LIERSGRKGAILTAILMAQIKLHENEFQANNGGELTGGNKREVILMVS
jgi:hypothetical protein